MALATKEALRELAFFIDGQTCSFIAQRYDQQSLVNLGVNLNGDLAEGVLLYIERWLKAPADG